MRLCERLIPGFAEQMRAEGVKKDAARDPFARGGGIRGTTIIVNLPGSPKGAVESLDAIADLLPHAVAVLHGAQCTELEGRAITMAYGRPIAAERSPAEQPRQMRASRLSLPFMLVGPVVVGGAIGYFLDRWLHTKPLHADLLGILGIVVGIATR